MRLPNEDTLQIQQLPVQPVELMCGDEQQQQPFESVERRTRPTEGILHNAWFYFLCKVFNFLEQHKYVDGDYQDFLNLVPYFRPSWCTLNKVTRDRILSKNSPTK